MSDGHWRNESQSGDALDNRDVKCTNQSGSGKQPEFFGLDDPRDLEKLIVIAIIGN